MQAIEFKTETNNGIIKLPYQFQHWNNKPVKVILLTEDEFESTQDDYTFDAVALNTKNFHFNREQANER
jgi:hypothetical protein